MFWNKLATPPNVRVLGVLCGTLLLIFAHFEQNWPWLTHLKTGFWTGVDQGAALAIGLLLANGWLVRATRTLENAAMVDRHRVIHAQRQALIEAVSPSVPDSGEHK